MDDLTNNQRQLFEILAEFFERATGMTPQDFAALGHFGDVVRANASSFARRGQTAFPWLEAEHRQYYGKLRMEPYRQAASLAGVKTVIGGTSRFLAPQLASVRKMTLYADSILIPDPILPWFEEQRTEERFNHVLLLEAVFWLLQLKPLVDIDLPRPAVVVFPSWERGLESQDTTTQEGQQQLVTAFLGAHTGITANTPEELSLYAEQNPDDFMAAIDRAGLFWAPGADRVQPLQDALQHYQSYVSRWRSPEWLQQFNSLPPSIGVLYAIAERIGPFYHLLENAGELNAQPMLCIDSHWFYFQKLSSLFEQQLTAGGHLAPETTAKIRALQDPTVAWLENVSIPDLAELRADNANENFRRRFDDWTRTLSAANITDLDRVVSELTGGLNSILQEHTHEVGRIRAEFQRKHKQTLVTGALGLAASFLPSLAPFIGSAAPVALSTKYGWDKSAEYVALDRASRSLVGVLSKAHETRD